MSKYYYLIAGLPNLTLDDTKIPFTLAEFRRELESVLTPGDKKLVDLFFLKFDNKNLIRQLRQPDQDTDPEGSITINEFMDLFDALKKGRALPKNKRIPSYFEAFFRQYLAESDQESKPVIPWEDRLATLYYEYAMKCGNEFVAGWFELNLNINNILVAITARKYGLNKADYIVGDNDVAHTLRTSNARDFGLGDGIEYLPALLHMAEEADLFTREKKLDQLKLAWLEEQVFLIPFDIESVYAYMLQLEMIERWVSLDKVKGEKAFRELIGGMKKGSVNALDEFKRNNKK